jgi:hypothetical protein
MVVGPLLMAASLLWLARVPASSGAWTLEPGNVSTWVQTGGYLVDFLPASVVFGIGLALMVAPLTTALMTSVPANRAGLGSAINNAISRVGPQLAGALIFVAITASFYAGVASRVPGTDTSSAEVRRQVAPLNAPSSDASPALAAAARDASTDAFHLSMLIAAGLLIGGAALNFVGIRDPKPGQAPAEAAEAGVPTSA